MNKINIIFTIILAVLIIVLGIRFFSGSEDVWICQNGEWVKHGNPSTLKPTKQCGNQVPQQADIIVDLPQPNQIVESPLVLTGKARGAWFFETSAPVRLLDNKGDELAAGIIQAIGEWMTTEYVPFTGELKFSYNTTSEGTLVFNKDNPSGLPQNDKEFKVPVRLAPTNSLKIKVYFNNNRLDPEISCNKVFPVIRTIDATKKVATAAVEELLKGPTAEEKAGAYFTNINEGVKVKSLSIINGVARIEFDETLEKAVGGSCRVSVIRAEITETLKQFPSVKEVIISVNGRAEDILQP